ncbi:MAG: hypothetical protein QM401_07400 [Bacillota bacterium]|nr:hypothetical protein [Bacillota bacterium]
MFIVFGVFAVGYFVNQAQEEEKALHAAVNVNDLKSNLVYVSYDDLARYPEQQKGKAVTYQGKVIQKVSDTGLRIGTKEGSFGSWDNVFYVSLKNETKNTGILEGDIVEFIGVTDGEQKAKTVLGQSVALPKINVYEIKVIQKR